MSPNEQKAFVATKTLLAQMACGDPHALLASIVLTIQINKSPDIKSRLLFRPVRRKAGVSGVLR